MSDFERLDELGLDRLSDEELVAYVVAARAAGQPDAGRRAVEILAFRLQPLVEARVAAKVAPALREDLVMTVLESFVRSAFDGKVIASVRAFISTIARRRIADHYRSRERNPDQVPLPGEHGGEEDIWGEEPATEDATAVLEIEDAIERVLDRRSAKHRQMIMLYAPEPMGGENLNGAEVVERMLAEHGESTSVDNVAQVWRRFRVDLEKELAAGEDGVDRDD
ncbi:MAG: hypothetical protein R2691_12710 [Solirubrobacterales bacterium]